MSIFKGTFKPGVKTQIEKRQEAILKRTSTSIQYYNSRNAWIRMTSAVDVGNDGGALASDYILLGGVLNSNGTLKSGIGSTASNAYSTITPGRENNRLGIRPMPGITGIDVKSKSAYGSLREVTVNFNAWDISQLEDLELLYMRPGYTVLIEWGWAPYLNNDGKLENNIPFTDILKKGKSKEQIWKEIFEKASAGTAAGNYDALYGFIKNYSWSARSDGGYDCTVTIISIGEILESLKINYGSYDSEVNTKGIFGVYTEPFTKDSTILASYSQNVVAGICNELYLILSKERPISNYEQTTLKLKDDEYTFFRFDVDIAGSKNDDTDNDFDDSVQIYILLKDFIKILNKYVLVKDSESKTPLLKLSVNEGNHMDGEDKELLCLAHPFQLSVDPSVCLIKNDSWKNPSSLGFDEGFFDDFSTLKDIMDGLKTSYFVNDDQNLGIIGNIFVNLGYLYSLVISDTLASQDKKEKNEIIFFDYIKSIMSGINTAIGNVATFDIFSDPIDSIARIIDVNFTEEDRNKIDPFVIQAGNTQSIIRKYNLESQIFPEQSSIIAIGAQAQGGALGSDTNTLVDFNQNLIDRIIPKKESPTAPQEKDLLAELKIKQDNLKSNMAIIIDFINEIDADWWGLGLGQGDFDVSNSNKYANALKDIIILAKSYTKDDSKNRAIIPTKLSLEIDGIGGIVIGNLFKIPDEVLPKGYKGNGDIGTRIGYIVTGLGHTIQNNDWVTKIDAQFIILDSPKEVPGVINLKDTKTIFKPGSTETKDESTKVLKTDKTEKGNTKVGTGRPITGGDKPRKTGKCAKSVKTINQNNAPEVKIIDRTPWNSIKNLVVNGPINVTAVGTPYDAGRDFAYKMHNTKVTSKPNRTIDYIVLHYTVSSNINPLACYRFWETVNASADFVIGRTGKIAGFKNFRNYYSWHYGDPTWGVGGANSRSVGFEIESFGPIYYCQTTKQFFNYYNQVVDPSEVAFTPVYRGYNMWHYHTNDQLVAIANLITALWNSGIINDKTKFINGMKAKGRYNILFPELGLREKPPPGIITHGTGQDPIRKIDTFPQKNLLDMLDDLPNIVSKNTKTSINWITT